MILYLCPSFQSIPSFLSNYLLLITVYLQSVNETYVFPERHEAKPRMYVILKSEDEEGLKRNKIEKICRFHDLGKSSTIIYCRLRFQDCTAIPYLSRERNKEVLKILFFLNFVQH